MSDETTHYEVLGVEPTASKEDIRAAYQERLEATRGDQAREQGSKRPDQAALGAARDHEARVRKAWQVLSDPYQRGRYDQSIALPAPATDGDGSHEDEADDEDTADSTRSSNGAKTPARTEPRMTRRQQMDAARPPIFTDDGTQLEVAGTSRRATAAVIDVLIIVVIYFAIVLPVTALANVSSKDTGTTGAIQSGAFFVVVIALVVIPTTIRGQTIGKRLTYTMLVDRATGHLPTPSRVLTHYLPPIAAFLLLGGLGLGAPIALMIGMSFLLTRDGMSLGDKLAKTCVVIARYRPERPLRTR